MIPLRCFLVLFAATLLGCPPRLSDDDDAGDDDAGDDDTGDDDTGDDDTGDDDDVTPPPYSQGFGAGWSFGFCDGACVGELWIDEAGLTSFSALGWDGAVYFERASQLLPAAATELAELQDRVDPSALDAVYGCPDCADGGEQHMSWDLGPVVRQVSYDFGSPPDELLGLHGYVTALEDELRTCVWDRLAPLAECEPYGG
jgi:hypothetical protein